MKKIILALLMTCASSSSFAEGPTFSAADDARHQKECQEVIESKKGHIDALIKSREDNLLNKAKSFFTEHHVTWSQPNDVLAALKAEKHYDVANVEKLYKQFVAFGQGDTGSKDKCTNLAKLVEADYKALFDKLDKEIDAFLFDFLKCPQKLSKENITALTPVQNGTENRASFVIDNPYVKKNVTFYVDPQNSGSKFPAKRVISKGTATSSNALVTKKVRTEGNKTYCPYAWKGSLGINHETIIYYRNDIN